MKNKVKKKLTKLNRQRLMGKLLGHEFLPLALKNCVWCKGYGFEWIEAAKDEFVDLSGYDYRHPCRCRYR